MYLSRRTFMLTASAMLATPSILRGQGNTLTDAVQGLSQLHSLQVSRGDNVVFTAAPRGPGLNRMANIKSCSKSIVALLLGTAVARNEIASINATLAEVAPALIPRDAEDGVADITMEDLVTLRAGLERTSGANYGGWVSSSNWVANALSRPLVAEPGTRMLYSTGSTHVLGAALTEATGESLLSLARTRLGTPLAIEVPAWVRDPQGYFLGGNEMGLRPTAMPKIAQMVRDGGRFAGEQVIPAAWIKDSLTPRGRSQWSGLAYGYGWFLSQSGYVLGRGYGGQIIAAHPQANLAVAITSDPTLPARSGGYFGDLMQLLEGPILDFA